MQKQRCQFTQVRFFNSGHPLYNDQLFSGFRPLLAGWHGDAEYSEYVRV
jgi:hypothetical protein